MPARSGNLGQSKAGREVRLGLYLLLGSQSLHERVGYGCIVEGTGLVVEAAQPEAWELAIAPKDSI